MTSVIIEEAENLIKTAIVIEKRGLLLVYLSRSFLLPLMI
jgi:hypothetical protein